MFALWPRETEAQSRHSPDLPRHCPEPPAPTGAVTSPQGKGSDPETAAASRKTLRGGAVVAEAVGRGEATGWWQLPGRGAAAGGAERGRSCHSNAAAAAAAAGGRAACAAGPPSRWARRGAEAASPRPGKRGLGGRTRRCLCAEAAIFALRISPLLPASPPTPVFL